MEAADEIQKETIIKDDDVALGNGDVSSSADLSLEEPSPGFHIRIIIEIETSRETLVSFQPLGRNITQSSWLCCYPFVGRSDTREFIQKTVFT